MCVFFQFDCLDFFIKVVFEMVKSRSICVNFGSLLEPFFLASAELSILVAILLHINTHNFLYMSGSLEIFGLSSPD